MGRHRQTNYHGSREYAVDRPNKAAVGQLRLTLAWLLDSARRRAEPLLRYLRLPTGTADHSDFTWLGSAELRSPRDAGAGRPFPERDDAGTGSVSRPTGR